MCMSVCKRVCVLYQHTIPHPTSNKSQQPPKVQLLSDGEPGRDLSEGLRGCASASVAQARALAPGCILDTVYCGGEG